MCFSLLLGLALPTFAFANGDKSITYIKTRDMGDALGFEVGSEGKVPLLESKES